VLSLATTRRYLKEKNSSNRWFLGHGNHAGSGSWAATMKRRLWPGRQRLEDLVGFADGAGLGDAKLADEAVLEGAPQPFNATFGLG